MKKKKTALTLSRAGWGWISRPYRYFARPRKKINGKSCQFFFWLFLNTEMEGWGLLFEDQYHLGLPGGGRNGQNCPNFIRYDPVGSSRKERKTNQNRWQVRHVASNFWDICLLVHLKSRRVMRLEKKLGQKVPNVLRKVGGGLPPRLLLSLQTPAPDRANCFTWKIQINQIWLWSPWLACLGP